MINETNLPILNVTYGSEIEENPGEDLPPLVTILLIVVGTIGNCLVCLAILFNRKLQNVKNYFLFSLAVTDLMVNLLILPGRMVSVRYKFQPSSFPFCYLYLVGDDFVTAASAIHICFISVMTYPSLKNPLREGQLTRKKIATIISLVWLIAFSTIIPYLTIAIITEQPQQPMYCPELLSNFTYFNVIVLVEALVIVVMIIIVFTSFVMAACLLQKLATPQGKNRVTENKELVRTMEDQNGDQLDHVLSYQIQQSHRESLRVTWLVSFAFILSMGPYACTNLFYIAFPNVIIPLVFLETIAYLSYANSVINPFIYALFDKTFRETFKNIVSFNYKRLV